MEKKDNKMPWKRKDQKEDMSALNFEDSERKGEDDFMPLSNNNSGMGAAVGHGDVNLNESAVKAPSASYIPKKEESYITKDVVVNGSISAVNSITIDGKVNGNVTTDNDVTVCGSIEGDISASSVKFSGAKIKGNIACKNNISFVKDSVVEGNVTGKNVEINGKIIGNLTAEESALIMGSAEINGDITAGLISVLEGAVIKGNVQVTKSELTPEIVAKESAAAEAKVGDDNLLKRYI
jgi:cytoskeletal protein CcmA (bactofilin family)